MSPFQHWLSHWLGLDNASGSLYLWWSGWFADIVIFGAIGGALYHANCHKKGCWRFGKPVGGTPYRACHKHHPAHEGTSRNVDLDTIHRAHLEAQAGQAAEDTTLTLSDVDETITRGFEDLIRAVDRSNRRAKAQERK